MPAPLGVITTRGVPALPVGRSIGAALDHFPVASAQAAADRHDRAPCSGPGDHGEHRRVAGQCTDRIDDVGAVPPLTATMNVAEAPAMTVASLGCMVMTGAAGVTERSASPRRRRRW
jgi:hypothetical protein